jgi:hypothetical protein
MMMGEKRVYILLTDTGTLFTRLIKLYTRKPYNHASIAFDAELSEVYSFGRKTAGNPFIGGFVREDMQSVLFNRAHCAIYSLTVDHNQLRSMNFYIQEIKEKKENYRYNLLGLIGVLFNMPVKRRHAFFCSQFVASILKESSIIIDFEKDLSLIRPSDLPAAANFELVFEGKLKDYGQRSQNRITHVPRSFNPIEM